MHPGRCGPYPDGEIAVVSILELIPLVHIVPAAIGWTSDHFPLAQV